MVRKTKKAAKKYGQILDMKFPDIPADYTEQDIEILTNKYFDDILKSKCSCVMCQGEFSFVYCLVSKLKEAGIKAVAACSERNVEEIQNSEGISSKKVTFQFVRFREYV